MFFDKLFTNNIASPLAISLEEFDIQKAMDAQVVAHAEEISGAEAYDKILGEYIHLEGVKKSYFLSVQDGEVVCVKHDESPKSLWLEERAPDGRQITL
jgi:hypothetical protein